MMHDFKPIEATIEQIDVVLHDNHLFTFRPETVMAVEPGQFFEISIPGAGSFPVSACALSDDGRLRSCIRRVGRVTSALFSRQIDDQVGVRGPFGNGFPLTAFAGRDALLVAGGLGMAPLRALLDALLRDRERRQRIILLYGSRDQESLLFRSELIDLARAGRIELRLSVDFAIELPEREHGVVCQVGLVDRLLSEVELQPQATTAAVCGPPALYQCVLEELASLGVASERIFATLERRMRCGVGECCHCVTAGVYLCKKGPVFSLAQLRSMEGAI